MPGGLPEPRPGSSALVPWMSCMLLRPSLFELVRSARLIRIKRGSLAPWDFAFLDSRMAASKRARCIVPLQGMHSQDSSRKVRAMGRSEEHTSELQSRLHLVCRLLLEKKKKNIA